MAAAIQHARRTYTTDGTTGNVSVVTGLPFTPKACRIESTGSTARDVIATDRMVLTECYVDGSTAMGSSIGTRDNGVVKRHQASGTGSLIVVDATSGGATPEVQGTPALTANGLDINFTAALSGRILEFTFIGGDDVTAKVVEIQINDGSLTGLGFTPEFLWGHTSCQTQGATSDTAAALWTRGVSKGSGSANQWVVSLDGDSARNAVQDTGSFLRQIQSASNIWTMSITSFDADGFSWSGSNADNAYILAVNLTGGLTFVTQFERTADDTPDVSESLPDTLIDDLGVLEIITIIRLNNGNTSSEGLRYSTGRCFVDEEQSCVTGTHNPATGTDTTLRSMSVLEIVRCGRDPGTLTLRGEITAFQRIPTIRWITSPPSPGTEVKINIAAIEGVAAVPAPKITSVTGSPGLGRVLNGDTGVAVVGTTFMPPGVTDLHYADGKVFASATKVLQAITVNTDSSITWNTVVTGAVGDGANYIFVRTDVGGGGEQVSAAFPCTAGLNIRQAKYDNDTLAVLEFGREVFAASDNFDLASQTAVSLTATTDLTPGTRKENHKTVGDPATLTVMTAPEILTADAKYPEVTVHSDQFVIDVRDPTIDDDLKKLFFRGARWFRTDTLKPFGLLSNAVGAAVWITEALTVDDAAVGGFIHDTNIVPIPSSPALIPFSDRTGQTPPPNEPVTNVGGTFTPAFKATLLIHAEFSTRATTVSSNDAHLRLAVFKDVNAGAGPYTQVQYSDSRTEVNSNNRDRHMSIRIVVAALTTDTFQIHMWKDQGSATCTAYAHFIRVSFQVMDTG